MSADAERRHAADGTHEPADRPDDAARRAEEPAPANESSARHRSRRRRRRPADESRAARLARGALRSEGSEALPAPARRELVDWRHPQRWLAASATVLLVGLGLVGLGPSALGTALSLLGAVAMLYAIHKYGRLGPEHGR